MMFYSVSSIRCPAGKLDEYLALRNEVIDPLMMAAPGFVSRSLLKKRGSDDELLLIVGWASTEAAQAYRVSPGHDGLRDKTMALLDGNRPVTTDFDVLAN